MLTRFRRWLAGIIEPPKPLTFLTVTEGDRFDAFERAMAGERYLTPEEQRIFDRALRKSATVRHGVKREPAAFSSSAQADWDDRMRRRRR